MRKLLIIICLILTASLSYSATTISGRPCPGGVPAGSSCTTSVNDYSTQRNDSAVGTNTNYGWAGAFIASESYSICKVTTALRRSGSPTGAVHAAIYASTGGGSHAPTGSALCTSSDSYNAGTMAAEGTLYAKDFTFSDCSLTSGTIYFLYIYSDTLNTSSVYFGTYYHTSGADECGTGVTCRYYYNTGSWTAYDGSTTLYRITYK